MKALFFSIIAVIAVSVGCSSSNSITTCKTDVEIVSVSYQERVSGVEGRGSIYYFDFEFKISEKGVMPDSVFFKNNAGKILRNYELNSYYAKVLVKPASNVSSDNGVKISFKKDDKVTVQIADSVTVLEKQYLP